MPRTFVLTAALAAALALLAAACTSGGPTGATPPPEATTPASTSTPRPTSTPERTPTPEPTPEVQWDENGLPLGIEGPVIVLHDGDWVRILGADGLLVNSIRVGHSVRLAGVQLVSFEGNGAWLIRLDGRRRRLESEFGRVMSLLPSARGDLAFVAYRGAHDMGPRAQDYTVVVDQIDGTHLSVPYPDFHFVAGSEPIIAFWRGTDELIVGSVSGSEQPPQFALLETSGMIALAGEPAHPVFSIDQSAWGWSLDPFPCLDVGGSSLRVDSLPSLGNARWVSSSSDALWLWAIGPGGEEFVYSAQAIESDPNDCGYAGSPRRLIHVTADGAEHPVESMSEIAERWGLLPPFGAECVDIPYPFCPAAHDIGIDQFGRVVYSPSTAHIVFLGTVDLPPP